jgi:hypothetical protein
MKPNNPKCDKKINFPIKGNTWLAFFTNSVVHLQSLKCWLAEIAVFIQQLICKSIEIIGIYLLIMDCDE